MSLDLHHLRYRELLREAEENRLVGRKARRGRMLLRFAWRRADRARVDAAGVDPTSQVSRRLN